VLFADLDHFKHVNDVHGHRVGDELLVAVARRISATVRPGDTVGRLSGDEFVILCDDLHDTADADHLAHRVAAVVAAPFALCAGVLNTTISVGIVFTANGDHDPGELLHAADIAMYRAKQRTEADPDVVVIDEAVPCPDSTEAELRRDLSG
jgi:diguanylate cyclase (GGDEF)-like protein